MTAYSDIRSLYSPDDYIRDKEVLERGIKANEKTQPFRFLSSIGGNAYKTEEESRSTKLKVDSHFLRCREPVKDINSRAVSAINKVHIDKTIDGRLYQFGSKSASANEIEQKIKSHNYILSLNRGSDKDEREKVIEKYMPKVQSKDTRPYTASALLNDKPHFRIMTPNMLSTGGKQSLGDLLSDDQYRNELRQLEVVDDISEDNPE
jgi:hypothetical protein